MGPNVNKFAFWAIRGGPGWPINNRTGPILLPRHPLTYINLHIKYGSNPIRILSYRENDEVSADAAADEDAAAERRLNHSIPRTYFVRGIQLANVIITVLIGLIDPENMALATKIKSLRVSQTAVVIVKFKMAAHAKINDPMLSLLLLLGSLTHKT